MSNNDAIVVGVDGTGQSERAAVWAARQAAVFGRPLVLVYAMRMPVAAEAYSPMPLRATALQPGVEEEPARQWAHDMLERLAERCRAGTGVEVRTEVLPGEPAGALEQASDDAAFVVVGHTEEGGLARFLLGSTAQRLARSCPWPVVVVRDEVAVDQVGGPVVVGVDDLDEDAEAVRFAFDFALRHGLEVTVVHAEEDLAVDAEQRARGVPGDAGPAERHPGIEHQFVRRAGVAEQVLLDFSAGASLLVVGSHGKGAVRRAVLGSVSRVVIDRAACPVAVLPPKATTSALA
ncbi:MAG: universal stress protein [Saccharothrix sp.]|nr:universal stress protein [Saccharothrix sp.]